MATTTNTTTTTVDASLWWNSFSSLLSNLYNFSLSSDLPPHVVKKLEENRTWFVDTVSLFKPPNHKSKQALNSYKIKIGSHELIVVPELKDKALEISSYLGLDEVQSYILVERSSQKRDAGIDSIVPEFCHATLLQYYTERQCLLKCTRWILMNALCVENGSSKESNTLGGEALKLVSAGLENKLIFLLDELLSSTYPEQMDVDLFTLWAEETLTEENLVLDILFLAYYESLCRCDGEKWKKLCLLYKGILFGSCNLEKLAVSEEALHSSSHARVQLLLILIEALDLENLLQMVHDENPFRQGTSAFSLTDVQEMDVIVSSFNTLEVKEAGPLILTWAVFLCLITSLPGKEDNNMLMEIDHIGYVRQAFEVASLNYFLEILQSDLLKESNGPVAGYKSVLRTFISAFIASYEVNNQVEDSTVSLILDILCRIYRGEESLCIQFWDKESFIDGPVRCFLCNIEGEFPFRTVELVRFLSCLCEGKWPAECVFNFLDKSVGVSSLFEIDDSSMYDTSLTVETQAPLHVPGVETLMIPRKTRGHILRVVSGNTVLVRWEYTQSGVFLLLLRLAQGLQIENSDESFLILDLLNRMVSFNTGLCFALMDINNINCEHSPTRYTQMEQKTWAVEVISYVVRNLYPSSATAPLTSLSLNILAKMVACYPTCVAAVALKADIFDVATGNNFYDGGFDFPSSGSWLFSGRLAKILLVDCEQNDYEIPLTVSVLEFTMQLLENGLESDYVLVLIIFSLQYILVSHEYWKYKVKCVRWAVTNKVLKLVRRCIDLISYSKRLGDVVQDLLLSDSSIHGMLSRVICTTKQTLEHLYVSRSFEVSEIEGLELAICSALDVIYEMISKFPLDASSSVPILHRALMSSTTKPVPVPAAVLSLTSYFRNSAIQIASFRVLSVIFVIADRLEAYFSGLAFLSLDDKQITEVRHTVHQILLDQSVWNEDLFYAVLELLISAARSQPAFVLAIFSISDGHVQQKDAEAAKKPVNENSSSGTGKSCILNALLHYIVRSNELITSNPRILLAVLDFLKALWEGAGQYVTILEHINNSEKFWKNLSNCILVLVGSDTQQLDTSERKAQMSATSYNCQSAILEIMAYDMFLQKKLSHAKSLLEKTSEPTADGEPTGALTSKRTSQKATNDIMLTWCDSGVLHSLVKMYASCKYDIETCSKAKVAISLFVVDMMGKLSAGGAVSLSSSLIERIHAIYKQICSQPAFCELVAQYSKHGYSEGKELQSLILNDLYYHVQGEFEGRQISPGLFKELFIYLVESKFLEHYRQKSAGCLLEYTAESYLYDAACVRSDIKLDLWDYSDLKSSKVIAETMLECIKKLNSMLVLSSSKICALKSLLTLLTIYQDVSPDVETTNGKKIPDKVSLSCIDYVCQCFHSSLDSFNAHLEAHKDILELLATQAEFVNYFARNVKNNLSLHTCISIMRTFGSALKVLGDVKLAASVVTTQKFALMLLISVMEYSSCFRGLGSLLDEESVEERAEFSNLCVGQLPILCHCIKMPELCVLSLTALDLMLRNILMPKTWFPIIREHLHLHYVLVKLQDKSSPVYRHTILKFFLTLARVRGGAEMLLNSGFFTTLKVLFSTITEGQPLSAINNEKSISSSTGNVEYENSEHVWGLGLAVVAAMLHSLGDSSSYADIITNEIPYFFSEKGYLVSFYLGAPDFPSDDQDRKRPRARKTQTSLTALKGTEHTLMLMCGVAKNWNSWIRTMKEIDSQLREKSIHLLAFISRGSQHLGGSSSRNAPLVCPPVLKAESDSCREPSFINSKNGWFALSPLGCAIKSNFSAVSSTITALIAKDRTTENSERVLATHFSDIVALQIYRIAFLLLKFLCLQAKGAAKRAEDMGFIDLAHFPELPMPEILHGLQDQAISIVTELSGAHQSKPMQPEVQNVCFLLLQVMEMALYLELCVLQICGIRPVLGRMDDFSKELEAFIKATEANGCLKASLIPLKRIISLVYPGLLQAEGLS